MCLDRICEHFADSDALISRHQGLRYTYGQLKQEVENAARGLMWIGVEKGERVGVWSPNCAEWLIAQYALAKVGAIMVNIIHRFREFEHALTQSGVSVILAARGFRKSNHVALIDELAPRLPALKQTIYLLESRFNPRSTTQSRRGATVGSVHPHVDVLQITPQRSLIHILIRIRRYPSRSVWKGPRKLSRFYA